MKQICGFVLAISVATTARVGAQPRDENTDALKQRVLALARTVGPDDYAFTRKARVEQIEAGKKEETVTIEQFDPAKPAQQRWTLVSVDGRAPTSQELERHAKEAPKRNVAHYGRVATYFGAPATAAEVANGRSFRFVVLPKESLIVNGTDLSAHAVAEAIVATSGAIPFVEQVRFTLTRPARIKVVAKVEQFEATTRYRQMPNGKPVPVEQMSDVSGSMLGKTGRLKTVLTYTEHRAVTR